MQSQIKKNYQLTEEGRQVIIDKNDQENLGFYESRISEGKTSLNFKLKNKNSIEDISINFKTVNESSENNALVAAFSGKKEYKITLSEDVLGDFLEDVENLTFRKAFNKLAISRGDFPIIPTKLNILTDIKKTREISDDGTVIEIFEFAKASDGSPIKLAITVISERKAFQELFSVLNKSKVEDIRKYFSKNFIEDVKNETIKRRFSKNANYALNEENKDKFYISDRWETIFDKKTSKLKISDGRSEGIADFNKDFNYFFSPNQDPFLKLLPERSTIKVSSSEYDDIRNSMMLNDKEILWDKLIIFSSRYGNPHKLEDLRKSEFRKIIKVTYEINSDNLLAIDVETTMNTKKIFFTIKISS